ncbi:hypothetical protein [uncultured Pseudomonas sp.]|uniref:hypothetical protein n=1 Tax=uncultured Pseudomonas sp. TaxID=114707 RepID=UPI0025EC8A91|nr:hypothetical protein [uncultured Pseudomonas sp.]
MPQPSLPTALLLATTLTLVACDPPAEPAKTAPRATEAPQTNNAAISALPALHVVLTWESLPNGENMVLKNYRAKLDACQGSGWPTRALSAEEEAKLGKGEVDIAIDARRQAARQIQWSFGTAGDDEQSTCLITLDAHEDQSEIEDKDGIYEAIDDATRNQDRLTYQAAGWTLLGEAEIQGQPCTRWRNERQEVCMWSGGLKWGFSEAPADVAGCTVDGAGDYLTDIPLLGQPSPGGGGCRLQVKTFSLGQGLLPTSQ